MISCATECPGFLRGRFYRIKYGYKREKKRLGE